MCGALAYDPPRASAAMTASYAAMKPSDTQMPTAGAMVAAAEQNASVGAFNATNIDWMAHPTAEVRA